jgi:hypothetical protein
VYTSHPCACRPVVHVRNCIKLTAFLFSPQLLTPKATTQPNIIKSAAIIVKKTSIEKCLLGSPRISIASPATAYFTYAMSRDRRDAPNLFDIDLTSPLKKQ